MILVAREINRDGELYANVQAFMVEQAIDPNDVVSLEDLEIDGRAHLRITTWRRDEADCLVVTEGGKGIETVVEDRFMPEVLPAWWHREAELRRDAAKLRALMGATDA